MQNYEYSPKGVCSRRVTFDIDEGKLYNVHFEGGCNGNLKGISALVKGQNIDDVIERLDGIQCGFKSTSCPDHLAKALKEVKGSR